MSRSYKFTYDNGGNIAKKETYYITEGTIADTPARTDTYDYETVTSGYGQNAAWKDQLKSYNGTAIRYDESGNPLNYLGKVMTWRGRKLTSIDGIAMDYDYNGLRVRKGDKTYYWQSGNLIMERWVKNGEENYIYYYYDESGVCGMNYNGTEYYYRKNILGDVIAIYDSLGNLQCRYVYDAWGNHKVYNASRSEIGAEVLNIGNVNSIRYRGYYWDKEFNLYYLQSRYYDPTLGRFISADAVDYLDPEDVTGLNLYAYCGNNPVNRYDPTGHSWKSFWNGVGEWFSDHWKEVAIGTAFIVGGALVTALTAGAGVGAMAAFGSALLSSTIQVGISVGTSVLVGGLVSVANGGGFFDNVGDNIANAYMWGGIFSGGAQILGGGFRIAANKGVTTGRAGGIKLGNSGVKILSPDKNSWAKAGGTLIKFGNAFRIDTGAMWGLHMHILSSGHLPLGSFLAGLIGTEY